MRRPKRKVVVPPTWEYLVLIVQHRDGSIVKVYLSREELTRGWTPSTPNSKGGSS